MPRQRERAAKQGSQKRVEQGERRGKERRETKKAARLIDKEKVITGQKNRRQKIHQGIKAEWVVCRREVKDKAHARRKSER